MSVVAEEVEIAYGEAYLLLPEISEAGTVLYICNGESSYGAYDENNTAVHILFDHALKTVVVCHTFFVLWAAKLQPFFSSLSRVLVFNVILSIGFINRCIGVDCLGLRIMIGQMYNKESD